MAVESPRLEPPAVPGGRVLLAGGGLLLFLLVALAVLTLQFRLATHGVPPPRERAYPAPELEINIDPRRRPASRPGPVPASARRGDPAREAGLRAAMAVIAAKSAHGYDPMIPPLVPAPPRVAMGAEARR